MEIAEARPSSPDPARHRSVSLLQIGVAAAAVTFVPGHTGREDRLPPPPTGANSVGYDPNAEFAFPSAPYDSPLSNVSAPQIQNPTSAPSTATQPGGDARILGPLTPTTPIQQVVNVPRDETYSPLWWFVAILAAGQVVNTIRGLVNSPRDLSAPLKRFRSRSRFEAGRDLSSPSMNSHIFEYTSGSDGQTPRLQLSDVITKKKPKLGTMINNSEVQRVFLAAAECCTDRQPFPSLKLGEAAETTFGKLRRRLRFADARDPNELQRVYLRELNKIFRDAYSELHKDGLLVKEREREIRKAILSAFELNFPLSDEDKRAFDKVPLVHASWHRTIWVCEVKPKISRDLILADISDEAFQLFGNPTQVNELLETSPDHAQRLSQFQDAYRREQEYQGRRNPGEERWLFPKVKVFTDISDKTVPAFIASLLAKYDRKDLAAQLAQVARAHIAAATGGRKNQDPPGGK